MSEVEEQLKLIPSITSSSRSMHTQLPALPHTHVYPQACKNIHTHVHHYHTQMHHTHTHENQKKGGGRKEKKKEMESLDLKVGELPRQPSQLTGFLMSRSVCLWWRGSGTVLTGCLPWGSGGEGWRPRG